MSKMKKKGIGILCAIALSITLVYIFINKVEADAHSFEKVDTYTDAGYEYDVYNLYFTISGNNRVNQVSGYIDIVGYEFEDFEIKGEFQEETLDLDPDGGKYNEGRYNFSLVSNKEYTASDGEKIVYATVTVKKPTNAEKCLFEFYPNQPSKVSTNDVSIEKKAVKNENTETSLSEVNIGDQFFYKVTITNTSRIKTDEVVLTDTIPDVFKLDSSQVTEKYSECSVGSNQAITCNIGSMEVDESITYYFPVTVLEEASGSIKNTATATINDKEKSSTATVVVLYSNITITKEASVKNVRPGDTFYYTITIENTGTGRSGNLTLTDTLDSDLTFINSNPSPNNNTGQKYTWNLEPLDAHEKKTITIEVRLNNNTQKANITNSATVCDENKDECSDDDITIPVVDSDITITKEANSSEVRVNDTFTYTITVTNTGNADSKNIVVTDTLNNKLKLISADVGNEYITGNTFTYTIDSLDANGGKKTFTLTVQVLDTANTGEIINNTACATETGKEEKCDSDDVKVFDSTVTITKSVNKSKVNVGEEFTYTIEVKNTSDYNSRELTLTDTINSNLEIISAPNGAINGNTITYDIGILEGQATKTYTITVKAKETVPDNTTIHNVAILKEVGKEDQEDDADVTVVKPDLTVTKTANTSLGGNLIKPNEQFTYTIVVSNTGNGTATGVKITDEIDSRLTIIDADGGTINNRTITWDNQTINSRASLTLTITVKLNEGVSIGTTIPNIVVVTDDSEEEKDDEDVTVTDSLITLKKEASVETVKKGDFFYYTIRVSNTGNSAENNLTITDDIPNKLSITEVNVPSGVTYNENNNKLTFNIATIAPEETYTITVYVEVTGDVKDKEVIDNTAILTYDDKEITSSDDVTVIDSDLSVQKTPSKANVSIKEEYTYTITITNNGPASATNVELIDTYDEDIEIINSNGGTVNEENHTITWNIANINAKEQISYTITVRVKETEKTSVLNSVVVKEPGKPDKTDEVEVEVGKPKLTVSKMASVSETTINGEFEYYITVRNDSNYDAKGITLTDVFDTRLIIIDNDGGILGNNNDITWNFDLSANNSIVFTVKVKLQANITEGSIPNIATITYNEEDTPSNEVIVTITNEIENPQTGSFIKYSLILGGVALASGIIIYAKKKKRLFKI